MNHTLVSVILPVRNCEKFVGSAIRSILNQTLTNLELIIINDGSTDKTGNVIFRSTKDDPRVKIIEVPGVGLSVARNLGISAASGKYIAFMDADDISLRFRLERQVKWLEKSGADICGGSVLVFGSTCPRIWRYPAHHDDINTMLLFNSALANPTVLGKREVFLAYPADKNAKHAEDYRLWVHLLEKNIRLTNLPEVVLLYRIHKKQISSANRDSQQARRSLIARTHWKNNGLDLPCKSIEKFQSPHDLAGLISALSKKLFTAHQVKIIEGQIWKASMRSAQHGLSMFKIYKKATWLSSSWTKRAALFFACLLRFKIR